MLSDIETLLSAYYLAPSWPWSSLNLMRFQAGMTNLDGGANTEGLAMAQHLQTSTVFEGWGKYWPSQHLLPLPIIISPSHQLPLSIINFPFPSFFFNIYLFIWLCRVLVVARRLLSSCGTPALEHEGSVVVAHGLSCPVGCGILVPWPDIEPTSPALEGGF